LPLIYPLLLRRIKLSETVLERPARTPAAEEEGLVVGEVSVGDVLCATRCANFGALPKDAEGVERGSRRRRGHVGAAVEWLWSIGIEYL
jgi:hypothetical protein